MYNLNETGKNTRKEDDTSIFVKSELLESANALFPGERGEIPFTEMPRNFEFTKSLFDNVVKVLEDRTEEMEDLDRKKMMDMLLCIVFLEIKEEYLRDLYRHIVRKSLFGKNSGDIIQGIEQRKVDSDTMSWIGMCILRGYTCMHGIYISEEKSNILLTCDWKKESKYIRRAAPIQSVKISPEVLQKLARNEMKSSGKVQLSALVWILRTMDVYWLSVENCDLSNGYMCISKMERLVELSVKGCKGVSGDMDIVDGLKDLERLEIDDIPATHLGIVKILHLNFLRKLSMCGGGLEKNSLILLQILRNGKVLCLGLS